MAIKDIQEILTEQPESGGVIPGSSFTITKTTRVYKFNRLYTDRVKKSMESSDQGLAESDGYLVDWRIDPGVSYYTLTCIFSNNAGGGELPAVHKITSKPFYSLTQSPGNIPLEQLDGFKTKWIYDLAAVNGTVLPAPAWWDTATDTTIPAGDEATYAWVKDTSQTKEGWFILKGKTKKGATEKQNSNAVIEKTIWMETELGAIGLAEKYTYISTPGQVFGIEGQWLVLPSTVAPDGDLWKITTTYLNAETWDADIYA